MTLRKMQNYKHVFVYGKTSDLNVYIEIKDKNVRSFYELKNRCLSKYNTSKGTSKAIIQFEEDCTLHHRFFNSESRIIAIKRGSLIQESPKSSSKIYISNEHNLEGCTLKPSLIETWLKIV